MPTTVYSLPKEVKLPEVDYSNYNHEEEQKKENEFLEKLRNFIKPHSNCKYNGKIAKFPTADSYALYMVVSVKPSKVVHLELGDAWNYQYIHRLSGKDIADNIDAQEKMAKLFGQ